MDNHIQYAIDNIGHQMLNPEYRRTGKTYRMCREIIAATEEKNYGTILVISINKKHTENLHSMLIRVADAVAATYTIMKDSDVSEIHMNGCSIIFELAKNTTRFAGMHPSPQRFVDHFTEEEFVLEGLRRLRDKLKNLKTGL